MITKPLADFIRSPQSSEEHDSFPKSEIVNIVYKPQTGYLFDFFFFNTYNPENKITEKQWELKAHQAVLTSCY